MQAVTYIFLAGKSSGNATTNPYAIAPRRPPKAIMNWSTFVNFFNLNLLSSQHRVTTLRAL